jgi:hypothetical protein
MQAIREHDRVVLTADLPTESLAMGDAGTVVHVHDGGNALDVEFISRDGTTFALVTIEHRHVRLLTPRELDGTRRTA